MTTRYAVRIHPRDCAPYLVELTNPNGQHIVRAVRLLPDYVPSRIAGNEADMLATATKFGSLAPVHILVQLIPGA